MLKTYRYRIYPTDAQQRKLLSTLDLCRSLYNGALQERIASYKQFGRSPSCFDQIKLLPEVKKLDPEYQDVHSQILQDVLKRLDKAYQSFFRRIKRGEKPGFPRFQGRSRYNSFTFPQSGFRIEGTRLFLSRIGHVKIIQHREMLGQVKTCSIVRTSTGKWYCCFSTEVEKQPLPKTGKEIGIDLGLKNFLVTSDNVVIAPEKFLNRHLERLAAASKRHSRKKTPATRKRVARLHEKIVNCRQDWQHKVANRIIQENDTVVVEDLSIQKMQTSEKFGAFMKRSIADASWGKFVEKLQYKAEYAGRVVVMVDPRNTSRTCSGCGAIRDDLTLEERSYRCDRCGLEMDRDLNAAINIKKLGIRQNAESQQSRDILC